MEAKFQAIMSSDKTITIRVVGLFVLEFVKYIELMASLQEASRQSHVNTSGNSV
jgi:hypothetical protein